MKRFLKWLKKSKFGRILLLEVAIVVLKNLNRRYPVYSHVVNFFIERITDEIKYLSGEERSSKAMSSIENEIPLL